MEQRPTAVAGLFYPAQPGKLTSLIDSWLVDSAPTPPCPMALIVPHAGYIYSGPIAAAAYRTVRGASRINDVVLIGPAHRKPVRGIAASSTQSFASPLGPVPVNTHAVLHLVNMGLVQIDDLAHAQEHALEVHLPFLLRSLPQPFSIIPLLVGQAAAANVTAILETLWRGDQTLLLISSDLSHYLDYRHAQATDQATVDDILQRKNLTSYEQACGAIPVNGLLEMARRHQWQPRLLDLRNSGDTAGDWDRVVGYAAIAFEADHAEL